MKHLQNYQNLVPGLFDETGLRSSVHIPAELFQEHLDLAAALPRNVKRLTAQCHKGYISVAVEVTQRLRLFLNMPEELVFTVSVEELILSEHERRCVLRLDGPVAERGRSFVVQLAVTLVEDLVIYLLKGERVRFADQYTESILEWPRVEVLLDSIAELQEIQYENEDSLWTFVGISGADITESGITVSLTETAK